VTARRRSMETWWPWHPSMSGAPSLELWRVGLVDLLSHRNLDARARFEPCQPSAVNPALERPGRRSLPPRHLGRSAGARLTVFWPAGRDAGRLSPAYQHPVRRGGRALHRRVSRFAISRRTWTGCRISLTVALLRNSVGPVRLLRSSPPALRSTSLPASRLSSKANSSFRRTAWDIALAAYQRTRCHRQQFRPGFGDAWRAGIGWRVTEADFAFPPGVTRLACGSSLNHGLSTQRPTSMPGHYYSCGTSALPLVCGISLCGACNESVIH
jgi:hypothetical protein